MSTRIKVDAITGSKTNESYTFSSSTPATSTEQVTVVAHSGLTQDQPERHVIICTSSTRPANPPTGQHIYETDTKKTLKNDGTPSVPVWNAVSSGGKGIGFCLTGDAFVKAGVLGYLMDISGTIKTVKIAASVAPTGTDLIVDIHKNGTTIFTTQTNRPRITAGSTTGTDVTSIEVSSVNAGDLLTLDIDQVGSTTPGGNSLYVTVVIG